MKIRDSSKPLKRPLKNINHGLFERAAIIGIGQIGGSLGWALRKNGLVKEVVGAGRTIRNLRTALSMGLICSYALTPERAVKGADLVVFATPVSTIPGLIGSLADVIDPGAVVTDVGSVKGAVVKAASVLRSQGISFIGGHPIAGTERSGASSADPGLFKNRIVILTPAFAKPAALRKVRQMWESLGARVVLMEPLRHDRIMAMMSHIPHLLSYAFTDAIGRVMARDRDLLQFAGGSFRDFTRIAGSSPEMWESIFIMNRKEIERTMKRLNESLDTLTKAINREDRKTIMRLLGNVRRLAERAR